MALNTSMHCIWQNACTFPVWLPHLLVQRGDGLNRGVQGVDVYSLLCVGVDVQQSSHQILDETHGLACYIPGLQLKGGTVHRSLTLPPFLPKGNSVCYRYIAVQVIFLKVVTWDVNLYLQYTRMCLFSHLPGAFDCVMARLGCCSH